MRNAPDQVESAFFVGAVAHTPIRGELELLPCAVIEVNARSGRIVAMTAGGEVALCARARARLSAARAAGRVRSLRAGQFLLPGFVDTHTHAPQHAFAGLGLDLPLMGADGWLETYTFPTERRMAESDDEGDDKGAGGGEAKLTNARAVYGAAVRRGLLNGTTTALYFGTLHLAPNLLLARCCAELGQRALVGHVAMDRNSPEDYCLSTECNIADSAAFVRAVRGMNDVAPAAAAAAAEQAEQPALPLLPLLLPCVTPRFVPTCSPAMLRSLAALTDAACADATQPAVRISTHVAESPDEVAFCAALAAESRAKHAQLLASGGASAAAAAAADDIEDDRDLSTLLRCGLLPPPFPGHLRDGCPRRTASFWHSSVLTLGVAFSKLFRATGASRTGARNQRGWLPA